MSLRALQVTAPRFHGEVVWVDAAPLIARAAALGAGDVVRELADGAALRPGGGPDINRGDG